MKDQPMTIKFNGTFETLHTLLNQAGIAGTWTPEPNGVFMLRCAGGANLHWASTSKVLWVDGAPDAAEALRRQAGDALGHIAKHT